MIDTQRRRQRRSSRHRGQPGSSPRGPRNGHGGHGHGPSYGSVPGTACAYGRGPGSAHTAGSDYSTIEQSDSECSTRGEGGACIVTATASPFGRWGPSTDHRPSSAPRSHTHAQGRRQSLRSSLGLSGFSRSLLGFSRLEEDGMEDAPSTPTREPRRESRGSTPRGAVTLLGSPVTKAAGGGATPRSPRPRATTLAEPPSWVECTERKGSSHASHSDMAAWNEQSPSEHASRSDRAKRHSRLSSSERTHKRNNTWGGGQGGPSGLSGPPSRPNPNPDPNPNP